MCLTVNCQKTGQCFDARPSRLDGIILDGGNRRGPEILEQRIDRDRDLFPVVEQHPAIVQQRFRLFRCHKHCCGITAPGENRMISLEAVKGDLATKKVQLLENVLR